MTKGHESWPAFLDPPDPDREPDPHGLRNAILIVIGLIVALGIAAVVGLFALRADLRGEFDRADFNLASAQGYVEQVRSQTDGQQTLHAEMDLPPELRKLSTTGRVNVTKNQDNRIFEVLFWAREGMQSSDMYVYLESRQMVEVLYPDVGKIETIAPGWYFIEGWG
jgi:hypothetical protein